MHSFDFSNTLLAIIDQRTSRIGYIVALFFVTYYDHCFLLKRTRTDQRIRQWTRHCCHRIASITPTAKLHLVHHLDASLAQRHYSSLVVFKECMQKNKKKDFRTPTKANNAFEDRSQQRRQPTVVLRLRESKVTPHDKAITLVTFPLQCLHLTLQARLLGLILPGTLTNLLTVDPHRGTENILFVYSFLSCTATLFN